jgi:thiamine-monophosphate kinase
MDERAALERLETTLSAAGDDAAVVDGLALTTDMLHDTTDFPTGTTRYTAGWRAVGASLSDLAAMGAEAVAAVAVYGAPSFDWAEIADFVAGASDVCELVGGAYVGGDLDGHEEFTVATTALGQTDRPVLRSGATPGDAVCVTGTLGRSGAAIRRFEDGAIERGNELFRFEPRIEAGLALAPHATAMMDSSDGLARSLHQLAAASDCGFVTPARYTSYPRPALSGSPSNRRSRSTTPSTRLLTTTRRNWSVASSSERTSNSCVRSPRTRSHPFGTIYLSR